jgi:phosphoribosylglycinamide formyltransferase-1
MFTLVVLASGAGSTLQALLDELTAGRLPGIEIKAIISDKSDSGALEKARTHGIPAIFLDPKDKTRSEYDAELAKTIGDVDLICLAGYMRILGAEFVNKYPEKILNVHPSLLPKFGGKGFYGMYVHEAVLAAGEAESGMTLHLVTEGVDKGPILIQKKVALAPDETPESLREKVLVLEKRWYPEAVRKLQARKTRYRIEHNRPDCIGCTACASIAPKFWEMSDLDGKSDIIGGTLRPDGWEEMEFAGDELELNKDAAEACPVNVIHLVNIGTGEQLI